jgi:hypothetical protein
MDSPTFYNRESSQSPKYGKLGRGMQSQEVQFISEENRKRKVNVENTCTNL